MEIEDLKTRCEHAASAWNDMRALRDSAGDNAGVHVPVVLSSYNWREAFGAAGKADTTVSADLRRPVGPDVRRPLDAILRLGLGDEERARLVPVPDDELFARVHAGESDY